MNKPDTMPTYAGRPRAPKRVWLIFYRIDGRWQGDGEWFDRAGAHSQARANREAFGWDYVVAPVAVPADAREKMRRLGGAWKR